MRGLGFRPAPKKIIPQGMLKFFVLLALSKKPCHGYELMQRILKKTKTWKPTAGSIYPLLHSLKKNGLVKEAGEEEKKIIYSITELGKKELECLKDSALQMASQVLGVVSSIIDFEFSAFSEMADMVLSVEKGDEREVNRVLTQTNKKLKKIVGGD